MVNQSKIKDLRFWAVWKAAGAVSTIDDVLNTLKGQQFIGTIKTYDNPEDSAYGQSILRNCGLCFYRYGHDVLAEKNDCDIVVTSPTPHELFGFKGKYLPEIINGKQVGNYCPHFLDFRAE